MDRTIIFIDGNNWHHALRREGVTGAQLDYPKLARKLIGDERKLLEVRYYVGQIKQEETAKSKELYGEQRRFLEMLKQQGVICKLGRIEKRKSKNKLAGELREYAKDDAKYLSDRAHKNLHELAARHSNFHFYVEKAVDVMIAVDMVAMAVADDFDAAYLLSADGDYTPVVDFLTRREKKVYAVSTSVGRQLQSSLQPKRFIRLSRDWFRGCYV